MCESSYLLKVEENFYLIYSHGNVVFSIGHITSVIRYRKAFRNYPTVFIKLLKGKYDFQVIMRKDKNRIRTYSQSLLYFLSFAPEGYYYDSKDDILRFNFNGRSVYLKGTLKNGDVGGIFGDMSYDINVRDKVVLDVGANIGDSAVFFALSGAKRVIAIEPIKKNFDLLTENVRVNNLEGIIIPIFGGLGAQRSQIFIDQDNLVGTNINLSESAYIEGFKTEIYSFGEILTRYECSVMKIDCEGCEYDLFEKVSLSDVHLLDIIVGEYHSNGVSEIEKILGEKAGFHVDIRGNSKNGIFKATKEN